LNALPFVVKDTQAVLRKGFTLGSSVAASFVFRPNGDHDVMLLLEKLFHFAHANSLKKHMKAK
jgi:hypothetical protein